MQDIVANSISSLSKHCPPSTSINTLSSSNEIEPIEMYLRGPHWEVSRLPWKEPLLNLYDPCLLFSWTWKITLVPTHYGKDFSKIKVIRIGQPYHVKEEPVRATPLMSNSRGGILNPQRSPWKRLWGTNLRKITDQQDHNLMLLLAHFEKGCSSVCTKMWQIPKVENNPRRFMARAWHLL